MPMLAPCVSCSLRKQANIWRSAARSQHLHHQRRQICLCLPVSLGQSAQSHFEKALTVRGKSCCAASLLDVLASTLPHVVHVSR